MLEEKVKEIANHFGIRNQSIKTMEECSELIQSIAKYFLTGNSLYNLIEELADVELMIDQIKFLLDCSYGCEEIRKQKIDRTLDRIKKGEHN